MKIYGVDSGVEFEQYVYDIFANHNAKVLDTPTSNDYGADLIIEYSDYKFCAQCKYYSKSVGVKAVQEVIGALSFYSCDYGMVITNATFTQQAENLASMNNILLVDGNELNTLKKSSDSSIVILDNFLENVEKGKTVVKPSNEWLMNDLVARYGVSSSKIYKDFIGGGLPFYKVGREYRFVPKKVKEWEIYTKSIPYGREKIVLPGYLDYKEQAKNRIRDARDSGDDEKVKRIKDEMREYGIRPTSDYLFAAVIIIGVLLLIYLGYKVFVGFSE